MISTLLLTGANNHDWRRSSPLLADLLRQTPHFEVEIAEDPSAILESLDENAEQVKLFVLDYNGPSWSEAARRNFVRRVENGAGVVIVHAADNAFAGWAEYEAMCGLIFRQKDGNSSGHGEFHRFEVSITDPNHPITRDLNSFSTEDELYHRMVRVPNADFSVIATAFSDPKQGGSGQNEPVLLVSQFGQGRIFHTLLGHVWKGDPDGTYRGASLVALQNSGFQTSFRRGCEWAARLLDYPTLSDTPAKAGGL